MCDANAAHRSSCLRPALVLALAVLFAARVHVKHTDGSFEYVPYFCLPAKVWPANKDSRGCSAEVCTISPGTKAERAVHDGVTIELQACASRSSTCEVLGGSGTVVVESSKQRPPTNPRPQDLNDVIAPSCYSCFDYPNGLADMVVRGVGWTGTGDL
jgi:hypothetical protein